MTKAKYATKRLDPRWQKKRLEILERDNWTCECCESTTDTLHVHHHYYVQGRDPWDYPNWALVTLCDKCHKDYASVAAGEALYWEQLLSLIGGPSGRKLKEFHTHFESVLCDNLGRVQLVVMTDEEHAQWAERKGEAK